jgi:hypothetical protein
LSVAYISIVENDGSPTVAPVIRFNNSISHLLLEMTSQSSFPPTQTTFFTYFLLARNDKHHTTSFIPNDPSLNDSGVVPPPILGLDVSNVGKPEKDEGLDDD